MSRGGSGRSRSWNGNQKLLLATCIMFGCAILVMAVVAMSSGTRPANVIAGCSCFGAVGLLPLGILIVSRRRSRGPKHRTDLVRSQAAAPAGHVDVEISADEKLPGICVGCGMETRRVTKLRFDAAYTDSNRYDWSRVHPILMLFLFLKFAFHVVGTKLVTTYERFIDHRKSRSSGMVFRIPHCRDCVRKRPIVQRHFDFHARKMVVMAPEGFRTRLAEMRKSSAKK